MKRYRDVVMFGTGFVLSLSMLLIVITGKMLVSGVNTLRSQTTELRLQVMKLDSDVKDHHIKLVDLETRVKP